MTAARLMGQAFPELMLGNSITSETWLRMLSICPSGETLWSEEYVGIPDPRVEDGDANEVAGEVFCMLGTTFGTTR